MLREAFRHRPRSGESHPTAGCSLSSREGSPPHRLPTNHARQLFLQPLPRARTAICRCPTTRIAGASFALQTTIDEEGRVKWSFTSRGIRFRWTAAALTLGDAARTGPAQPIADNNTERQSAERIAALRSVYRRTGLKAEASSQMSQNESRAPDSHFSCGADSSWCSGIRRQSAAAPPAARRPDARSQSPLRPRA